MDKYKGLRNVSYLCQKLGMLGIILWIINAVIFFVSYFSEGMKVPNFRELIQGYGGALMASIIPILLLYAAGGVINLLLDLEVNTRKT
jgi:hypothetical protein